MEAVARAIRYGLVILLEQRYYYVKPQTKKFILCFTAGANIQKIGAVKGWFYLDEKNQGNCRIFDRITPGGSDGWLVDLFPGRTIRFINGSETSTVNTQTFCPPAKKGLFLPIDIPRKSVIILTLIGCPPWTTMPLNSFWKDGQ